MCLIAFAIGVQPDLPLLLAGNRDEFFERPTDPLHRWPDGPGIWAGRDRRDGGTWLGLAENGRVAMLTNVRSADNGAGRRSRGELATRWLQDDGGIDGLLGDIDPAAYGGFNLVVGELHTGAWHWLSNRQPTSPHRDGTGRLHHQALEPGVFGLSNAALDSPWPKTLRLKTALRATLPQAAEGEAWQAPLREALADPQQASVAERPDTGVPADWEAALSSPFVHMPARGYGTRSSLLMRVQRSNAAGRLQADLHEWVHPPSGWSAEAPRSHRLGL